MKLSDFSLTRSMDIHGMQCHEWHDYFTMVRWEVTLMDNGALNIVESSTGRVAVVGATLVSLCYSAAVSAAPTAVPVVPDAVDEPTKMLEHPAAVEPAPAPAKKGPKRRFDK